MDLNKIGKMQFFSSWSGGKDSCLSLYRAICAGHTCKSLFTMINEDGTRSRSHGLTPAVLAVQAHTMNLPVCTVKASWDSYEAQFKKQMLQFANAGVTHGVFGDIDLEPHRQWVERVCNETGITAHLPLWLENRRSLVNEFVNAGFKAMIVMINTTLMPAKYLGQTITLELADDLESIGVDACGENGEFHTFVYDGPLFSKSLFVNSGDPVCNENYVGLPLSV
jgi:diphthine-ammonia ligase